MEQLQVIKDEMNIIKPVVDEARKLMKDMMDYPKKLDKSFYLGVQDELSLMYDQVLEKYLTIKLMADNYQANMILVLKKKYEGGKAPTVSQLEAEAQIECAESNMASALVESWFKSIKNALQTCRAHTNALSGKDEDTGE